MAESLQLVINDMILSLLHILYFSIPLLCLPLIICVFIAFQRESYQWCEEDEEIEKETPIDSSVYWNSDSEN